MSISDSKWLHLHICPSWPIRALSHGATAPLTLQQDCLRCLPLVYVLLCRSLRVREMKSCLEGGYILWSGPAIVAHRSCNKTCKQNTVRLTMTPNTKVGRGKRMLQICICYICFCFVTQQMFKVLEVWGGAPQCSIPVMWLAGGVDHNQKEERLSMLLSSKNYQQSAYLNWNKIAFGFYLLQRFLFFFFNQTTRCKHPGMKFLICIKPASSSYTLWRICMLKWNELLWSSRSTNLYYTLQIKGTSKEGNATSQPEL